MDSTESQRELGPAMPWFCPSACSPEPGGGVGEGHRDVQEPWETSAAPGRGA